ncbi:MAG: hypothetical protein HKN26_13515 [Acidimicrobiales bacterium]|nr:hypothetical protein [Acidimicrobiales bacterium]
MTTSTLDAARDIRPQLEAALADHDEGPLPAEAVEIMQDADLFNLMIPKDAGGLEAPLEECIDVFAEVSHTDGSAGWCLMASCAATGFFGAYGGDDFVAELTSGPHAPIAAGQFAPLGAANPAADGYQISCRYQFGSGINHAQWVGAGLLTAVEEGQNPDYLLALFPKDHATITGNWDVLGLERTASYDYHIDDVFVPEGATFNFFTAPRRRGGPVYDLGVLVLTAAGHAGFAIGVIRRALDELRDKAAGAHKRMAARTTLADSERFVYDLGVLESRFRSAEYWVRDAYGRAEASLNETGELDHTAMIEARQATTFITQEGADIVHKAYLHAGTMGLREGVLNQCFRDIHAGSQHAVVSPSSTEDFGKHLIDTAPNKPAS